MNIPTREQVEEAVGMGATAWDTIDPDEIIRAVIRLSRMTTEQKPALEVVAWGTTRTLDGKQILSEMCVSTNAAYVKVHNHHAWEPLVRLADHEAALLAKDAECEALRKDAARLDALREESWDLVCFDRPTGQGDGDIGWRVIGHYMGEPTERTIAEVYEDDPRAAIDAALVAAKGDS